MKKVLNLINIEEALALMGVLNCHAKKIDQKFEVITQPSDEGLVISGVGENVHKALDLWTLLLRIYRRDGRLDASVVDNVLDLPEKDRLTMGRVKTDPVVVMSAKGRPIRPKTPGQLRYIRAIDNNLLTFAVGAAGTGKTYLAVAMAVRYFKAKRVSRIILTRPAVEAGESLGFLPGDLQSKIDPYMRPLYDALYDLMGAASFNVLLERGVIEISPLAYMRGRTLDDAFIILDEAQNTTPVQMKMFLTRIGFHSKAVVTGDVTQIDLDKAQQSGLLDIYKILHNVPETAFVELSKADVVRNRLVKRIIAAYEAADGLQNKLPKPHLPPQKEGEKYD